MDKSIVAPLKIRSFRLLFGGQVFSDLGNWLDFTALLVLIAYHWELGASAVAALMIALGIPWVLLSPLLSVWADRLPRRFLMLTCDFFRLLVILGFVFAPNLYVLLPLVFAKALLGGLFFPARQGAMRQIVPEEQMPQAVSLSQLSVHATQVVGPALGGMLLVFMEPQGVFLIEAGLLLISAMFLFRLPKLAVEKRTAEDEKTSYWQEFREGLQHVKGSRMLAVSIALMSVGMFIVFLYEGLLVLWTKELALGEGAYGYLMSTMGLSGILGVVVVGQWNKWQKKPLHLLCGAGLIIGLLNAVIGLGGLGLVSGSLAMWIGFFFLFGFVGAVATIPSGYILQAETPSHLIGRVSSVSISIENGAMLIAPSIGAALAKFVGIGGVFLLAGVVMTVLAALVLLVIRRLVPADRQPLSSEQPAGLS